MKIQSYVTAATTNLQRLAAAILAALWPLLVAAVAGQDPLCTCLSQMRRTSVWAAAT